MIDLPSDDWLVIKDAITALRTLEHIELEYTYYYIYIIIQINEFVE